MTATVELADDKLRVDLAGASGTLAFKSHVEVPLGDVRAAHVEEASEARSEQGAKEYWPVHGSFVPGVIREGTFGKGDDKQFWYVHEHSGPVLVVDLDHDTYSRIVLQIADPDGTAEAINAACASPAS
jgi:hypothetical protein